MSTEMVYLGIGLGALIVIAIAVYFTMQIKAKLSKEGFEISADKNKSKDTVSVKGVKSKSDIAVQNREGQNIDVENVDDSKIRIK